MNQENHQFNTVNLQAVNDQIWQLFLQLRGLSIGADEYDLVLYLLILYNEDRLADVKPSPNLFLHYDDYNAPPIDLNQSRNKGSNIFRGLYDHYKPVLNRLGYGTISGLLDSIQKIDRIALKENFSTVFDLALDQLLKIGRHRSFDNYQPREITQIILELLELPAHATIYNPFAGYGSFGTLIQDGHHYYGQELNEKTWAIGALRLIAYGKNESVTFNQLDSIWNWSFNGNRFDAIVVRPPMQFNVWSNYRHSFPDIESLEDFLLKKASDSLTKNGKMILVLPNSSLVPGYSFAKWCEYIIQNNLLETVISLPEDILSFFGENLNLVIISKSNKHNGAVLFVDGTECFTEFGRHEKRINVNGLLDLVRCRVGISEKTRIVNSEEIKHNNHNLHVKLYFQKEIDGPSLSEIIEQIPGETTRGIKSGFQVQIRDLKDDVFDYKLHLKSIEKSAQLSELRLKRIDQSCILLALRGKSLKPTYFDYQGEPIYIGSELGAFRIKSDQVVLRYLIIELHSDYFKNALQIFQQGIISRIRQDNLLRLKIKLPSLDNQIAKIESLIQLEGKIKNLEQQRDRIASSASDIIHESASMLTHTLGTPLMQVSSAIRNIKHSLNINFPEWSSIKIDNINKVTLADAFNTIHRKLDFINDVLVSNSKDIEFRKYELKQINLVEAIEEYILQMRTSKKNNINITKNFDETIKDELQGFVYINGNTKLLNMAFDIIEDNVLKHAFTDDNKQYRIEFRLDIDNTSNNSRSVIKVGVYNNGCPFPQDFTLEKLIRKGASAGPTGNTGIGGYQLNEIIAYMNNGFSTLEIVQDISNFEFQSAYVFTFPILDFKTTTLD
jgi:type I restriction enzyme M protein